MTGAFLDISMVEEATELDCWLDTRRGAESVTNNGAPAETSAEPAALVAELERNPIILYRPHIHKI
jgi:hypothetical protein